MNHQPMKRVIARVKVPNRSSRSCGVRDGQNNLCIPNTERSHCVVLVAWNGLRRIKHSARTKRREIQRKQRGYSPSTRPTRSSEYWKSLITIKPSGGKSGIRESRSRRIALKASSPVPKLFISRLLTLDHKPKNNRCLILKVHLLCNRAASLSQWLSETTTLR